MTLQSILIFLFVVCMLLMLIFSFKYIFSKTYQMNKLIRMLFCYSCILFILFLLYSSLTFRGIA